MRGFCKIRKINELYQLYQNSYVQKLKIKNNKFNQNINLINKCEKEHLLCCIVIFSTKFQPVPLARNLMSITKNRQLSKRGPWSVFYQFRISRTRYHDYTYWVMYRIKLHLLNTCIIPTENQYRSQQLALPLKPFSVQCSHPVFKMVPLLCCFLFFSAGDSFEHGRVKKKNLVR